MNSSLPSHVSEATKTAEATGNRDGWSCGADGLNYRPCSTDMPPLRW